MEVKINSYSNLNGIPPQPPKTGQTAGAAQPLPEAELEEVRQLESQLEEVPDVRTAAVERARDLLATAGYPSRAVLERLAERLAGSALVSRD